MENSDHSQPGLQIAAGAATTAWWYFLLRGLLFVGAGAFLLIKPGLSAVAFAQVIGAFLLIDGVLAILAGIRGRTDSRLWTISRGILLVLTGVFIFTRSYLLAELAMTTVLYILAALVLIGGIIEIVTAIRDRDEPGAEETSILGGVLSVAFGLLLFSAPLGFGLLVVRVVGIVVILIGIVLLWLANRFRKLGKRIQT